MRCPETLGTGVKTGAVFCFVLAGRDPAEGVLVTIPPHTGPATLLFDIHNRHTYSEEDIRAGRGFAKYTAVIGVLTLKGELLSRGAVQSEFRTANDLYDRVSGGAGPGGVKAVAPLGREEVSVTDSGRRRSGQPARRSARRDHGGGARDRDARPHGRHHQQRPGRVPPRARAAGQRRSGGRVRIIAGRRSSGFIESLSVGRQFGQITACGRYARNFGIISHAPA